MTLDISKYEQEDQSLNSESIELIFASNVLSEDEKTDKIKQICRYASLIDFSQLKKHFNMPLRIVIKDNLEDLSTNPQIALLGLLETFARRGAESPAKNNKNTFEISFVKSELISKIENLLRNKDAEEKKSKIKTPFDGIMIQLVIIYLFMNKNKLIKIDMMQICTNVVSKNTTAFMKYIKKLSASYSKDQQIKRQNLSKMQELISTAAQLYQSICDITDSNREYLAKYDNISTNNIFMHLTELIKLFEQEQVLTQIDTLNYYNFINITLLFIQKFCNDTDISKVVTINPAFLHVLNKLLMCQHLVCQNESETQKKENHYINLASNIRSLCLKFILGTNQRVLRENSQQIFVDRRSIAELIYTVSIGGGSIVFCTEENEQLLQLIEQMIRLVHLQHLRYIIVNESQKSIIYGIKQQIEEEGGSEEIEALLFKHNFKYFVIHYQKDIKILLLNAFVYRRW